MSVSFLDSNILLYLFEKQELDKQAIANKFVEDAFVNGSSVISFQVVQECLNMLTRKLKLSPENVRRFMSTYLLPLWQIMPSQTLYTRALTVQMQTNYNFYDSLIIAAALEAGCTTLYTEDLQHNQQIQTLTIKNPFRDS
jgi:predicted nucleic acid-binding protein